MKKKKESRYKVVRDFDGSEIRFEVWCGDVRIASFFSRSNAESAIERYEAADRRRAAK